MELTKNQKSITKMLLMLSFLLTLNITINGQQATEDLKDFTISIEKGGNEIIMKCGEGCAWLDLTYENEKDFQAINEFGMTEIKKDQSDRNENQPKLLFTITKTENGVSLKGLKGTAWTELSFSLRNNQVQMIDQFGMPEGK